MTLKCDDETQQYYEAGISMHKIDVAVTPTRDCVVKCENIASFISQPRQVDTQEINSEWTLLLYNVLWFLCYILLFYMRANI